MALITQAEWARRQGISREAVRKQIQRGQLHLVDGKVDEIQAQKDILKNNRDKKVSASTKELLLQAKLENEVERGRILKLERLEKEQSLISADKLKETLFRKGRVIRDAMLNLPDRVSSVVATMQDAGEIHILLTKEIRAILEELSNG